VTEKTVVPVKKKKITAKKKGNSQNIGAAPPFPPGKSIGSFTRCPATKRKGVNFFGAKLRTSPCWLENLPIRRQLSSSHEKKGGGKPPRKLRFGGEDIPSSFVMLDLRGEKKRQLHS